MDRISRRDVLAAIGGAAASLAFVLPGKTLAAGGESQRGQPLPFPASDMKKALEMAALIERVSFCKGCGQDDVLRRTTEPEFAFLAACRSRTYVATFHCRSCGKERRLYFTINSGRTEDAVTVDEHQDQVCRLIAAREGTVYTPRRTG